MPSEVRNRSSRSRRRGTAAPTSTPPAGDRVEATATESAEASQAWRTAICVLRSILPETTCELWLTPLRVAGEDGDRLVLSGPSHIVNWVRRRYPELVRSAVAGVSNYREVEFVGRPS